MTESETLRVALGFMSALDANDAEGVRSWMAPGATWWVDTGLDRASGAFGLDPGDGRPWPLHGEMDAGEKSDGLAGVRDRFPGGIRQIVRRSFAGGDVAVLEVAGDGLYRGEKPYRNRYCFVITVSGDRVTSVREYLDTRHAADVFEGRHLDRRSSLHRQQFPDLPLSAESRGGDAALRLLAAIGAGDQPTFLSLFTPDATWWADGGRSRRWSHPEAPPETAPDILLVGRVRVSERGARISELQGSYAKGLRIAAHRIIEDDRFAESGLVCVEAVSEGERVANGRMYQNRYAFVLTVTAGGLIDEVREYCDTQHAFDVYELDL
ncbi:nuclear transport factor 2 family protein [Microbacterium rhizomatis]|uniref:SnoaL-like domain-containing protein n=1 Tax=Microbacterium rhizomatis TaxID=1631477 RepID=A0A5J5J2F1_9MICO|nr:nuclear transport factor 2 family protein [Microbacterium rhizomatis]KAA9108214.1 hypothetical protein F6B43_12510 [Microbacterium rhizomatis]